MIPNYKRFDEIDILISSDITPEEDKRISEYLKEYKAKLAREKIAAPHPRNPLTAKAKH